MKAGISRKKLSVNMSFRRIVYSICFCFFCVIDQRVRTAYGTSGWLETFRDLTGTVMAIIILSHYKFSDFQRRKIPYLVWSAAGGSAAVLAFIWGIYNQRCLKDWFVILLDIFLFGFIVIHIVIDLAVEKKRVKLNKNIAVLWFLMLLVMIFSRSRLVWPFCYLVMFGCFYLTDYDRDELEDLFQGTLNGFILGFFIIQGLAFVFRPYDEVRYRGLYYNTNSNAFFYLEVLAALLTKLLYVARVGAAKWYRGFYWLMSGAVLAFIFMTVGRNGWVNAFLLVVLFLWAGKKTGVGKRIVKRFLLLGLCASLIFPACFGAARYLPPLFHHPVWFGAEWSESKVHSWDPWDSEKYVSLEEFMDFAVGRFLGSIRIMLERSPFLIHSDAAGVDAVIELPEDDSGESMELRMEIYRCYISRLNLWGNSKINEEGWGYHGHNILLQYGTDFGLIALALFLAVYLWNLIWLFCKFLQSKEERYIGYLFFSLITLLYGMLDCSWGAGSLGTLMMFFAWGETVRDENPFPVLTGTQKDAKIT